MLSSIHPLGERRRNNRFVVTAAAYLLGAIGGGLAVGALAGIVAAVVGTLLSASVATVAAGVVVLAALVADVVGITPPSPERQVDEQWLDQYRGWVYGGGFGVQLGVGGATYVTTWLTYAAVVVGALSGTFAGAVVVFGSFGLVRGLSIVTVRNVTSPQRLRVFFAVLARRSVAATQATGVATLAAAIAVVAPALL